MSDPQYKFDKLNVLKYMRLVVNDYKDRSTNEVDMTSLTESTADCFNKNHENGPLDNETHWIWECALIVHEENL